MSPLTAALFFSASAPSPRAAADQQQP